MGIPSIRHEMNRISYIRSLYKDIMNILYRSMDKLEEAMWQSLLKSNLG